MINNIINFFPTITTIAFLFAILAYKSRNSIDHFIKFFVLISEKNPLILDYSESAAIKEEKTESDDQPFKIEDKYEDKYLNKFKNFPNIYQFTKDELLLETNELERLKIVYEENRLNSINEISDKLQKISLIFNNSKNVENLSNKCKNLLLKYYLVDEEDDDYELETLFSDLLEEKSRLERELTKIEQSTLNEEDVKKQAHEFLLKNKHDQLINSYILEHTPLGNIYMRFNNDKKTFEYFSNNTIPYRYLEPVGRKYVMTYWCKPLFVDIEEELKLAEQKFDEEKLRREEEEKNNVKNNNKSRDVLAKLKDYNKDSKLPNSLKLQAKNRGQQNFVLPPQIKANLPNVNQTSSKQLLKENANRYTWEGRLSNFSPLKKINKTIVNKNLTLTFADFKKLQQNIIPQVTK
jgi:hypothetical protein